MPHHRARFTARGRWEVARRVIEHGETFAQAAAWANVSKSTVWEWVRRWRAASLAERASLACLAERSSRPRRSPAQVPAEEARGSASCVSRPAGARAGWPMSPRSPGRTRRCTGCCSARAARAARGPSVRRWSATCGRARASLLHMDVKKLGRFTEPGHKLTGDRTQRSRRVGWEYVHSIVDDCSRLAYSEIHDDETAPTVTAFTRRALDFFLGHGIVAERLMTDNAFAYVHNRSLRELLHARAIQHIRTRPYTPRTNGKVERYQQTLQREWAYALEYASSDARRACCHTGCATTTSGAPTAPSATARPLHRVREVTGLNT